MINHNPHLPSESDSPLRRLLIVLGGRRNTPSVRVRILRYLDLLREEGFQVTSVCRDPTRDKHTRIGQIVSSLPRVLVTRHSRRLLSGLGRRFNEHHLLKRASQFDTIYLSKVLDHTFLTSLRSATRARLVLDLVDAEWIGMPDGHFAAALSTVDTVTTNNCTIAKYLRQFNEHCVVIPDAPPLERFDTARSNTTPPTGDSVTIGWVGSRSTTHSLFVVWEALEKLFVQHPHLNLRLVGTGTTNSGLPPFERVRFSERRSYQETEMVNEVLGMDIGLSPLFDTENTRMRGALKPAIYMSGEAAVVATPVGEAKNVIRDGTNGMLATTTSEWYDKLDLLIRDTSLRQRITRTGLATVQSDFQPNVTFHKLKSVLQGQ